jgi:hypothetical protein
VPRGKEELLPQYQYQPYTTETGKLIGKALSHVPGVSASPAKVDNLVRGWSGGLGNYAMRIIDQALLAAGISPREVKPSKTLSDIPLLKAFAVRYPGADAESIRKFYDRYKEAQQITATAKALSKQGKYDEAAEVYQSGNAVKIEGVYKALRNAHRAIDKIYSLPDMTPDEKRKAIDDIYMGMIKIAENGNDILDNINSRKKPSQR